MGYETLIQRITTQKNDFRPVILPDFFLDLFIIAETLESVTEDFTRLARQGGGSIFGTNQMVRKGGNATNTASALYRLGIKPKLIVTTDEYGLKLLQGLMDDGFDLSHIHTEGRLSSTVSVESDYNGRRVNIMISDSGSVADFTFDDLTEADIQVIKDAPLVSLVCLYHNNDPVSLTSDLFSLVREGNGLTFLDIGDPSGRKEIVRPIIDDVLREGLVDILSINENEASWLVRGLSPKSKWDDFVQKPELWIPACQKISAETGVRVDLHTPFFTATVAEDSIAHVPTFRVDSRVICGAGDAWNAGDIYATLLGLSPKQRLQLANAVSGLYVSSTEAIHPHLSDVVRFLESKPPVQTM